MKEWKCKDCGQWVSSIYSAHEHLDEDWTRVRKITDSPLTTSKYYKKASDPIRDTDE